ncbi:hypothetical protein SFR_4007 [Streptomyces sp. FR-008]|nr:hypothetical protein SFR_4007 [Streptomyces sp. FR-008]
MSPGGRRDGERPGPLHAVPASRRRVVSLSSSRCPVLRPGVSGRRCTARTGRRCSTLGGRHAGGPPETSRTAGRTSTV